VRHILLPALDEARTRVVTQEMLEVEDVPDGFRLLHSPAFVDGIAGGDVIAADPEALQGFRVLSRGGNLAVVVVFPLPALRQQAEEQLSRQVEALRGVCDGGPPRMLVFTIPASDGFSAVEALFNTVPRRWPGATWYFGNVYAADHKTPLNWVALATVATTSKGP
jgi:hypothetical protein